LIGKYQVNAISPRLPPTIIQISLVELFRWGSVSFVVATWSHLVHLASSWLGFN